MPAIVEDIIACPECDLLQRIPALPHGGKALCPRCGCRMASGKTDSIDRTLALGIAAAIVLVIANVEPLMGLSAVGRHASTTILGGIIEMWKQGNEITSILVAFCIIVAPTVHIVFMLVILLAVKRPPAPAWTGRMMQMLMLNKPWAMIEVMMLGILVALVKIADLATVVPGIGMYAVGALIVLVTAMTVSFDQQETWARIRWVDDESA